MNAAWGVSLALAVALAVALSLDPAVTVTVDLAVALALPLFRCDAYRAAVSSVKASSVKASSCALKPGVEAPFSDTAPSEWNKKRRVK